MIIDAASNYFKHGYPWPEDWTLVGKKEVYTVEIVLKLGMDPKSEITDNLLLIANRLALGIANPKALTASIQEWRKCWARALYPHFGLPDPTKRRPAQ